jgi:hypothetical protein
VRANFIACDLPFTLACLPLGVQSFNSYAINLRNAFSLPALRQVSGWRGPVGARGKTKAKR